AAGYTNLIGVDPSAVCVRTVRERHDIPALQGTLSALTASAGRFDLVVFCMVLEHLITPAGKSRRYGNA
ncbi:MAG: class I SAM-dependent methyltransferase, partial [Armatimonadetes bacterium]|nr:class I SAM-dependent methyltransferase [Armatimonadota bacterium]